MQSIQFVDEHLIRKSVSLLDNIKLNKLPLFSQRIELKPSRPERTVTLLKADCWLFANFYVACQSRAGDPENFFAHESHAFPVSLSEYGKLHNCVKSHFIDCLQNLREPSTCLILQMFKPLLLMELQWSTQTNNNSKTCNNRSIKMENIEAVHQQGN